MNPAETTRSGSKAATASVKAVSHDSAVSEVGHAQHERGDSGVAGALLGEGARPVRTDRDDVDAVLGITRGVEERLEVAPCARDEHDDSSGGPGRHGRRAYWLLRTT